MAIVNTAILKNPLNWLIVWLMLLIAAFGGHFILTLAGYSPEPRNDDNSVTTTGNPMGIGNAS